MINNFTALGRHRESILKPVADYFIDNRLKSFCSAGCSLGLDCYDFLFLLIEKEYYNSSISISGYDYNEDIIKAINSTEPYQCCFKQPDRRFRSFKKDRSVIRPFTVLNPDRDYTSYLRFFNHDWVLEPKYKSIPEFFCHSILEPLDRKYDVVFCSHVLNHIYATNYSDIIIVQKCIDNLLNQTNKLLVLVLPGMHTKIFEPILSLYNHQILNRNNIFIYK